MKFKHICWQKNEKTNTDKVWGVILLRDNSMDFHSLGFKYVDNDYISFWGRRGAKLQTKMFKGSDWDAIQMFEKKQRNGYQSIEIDELDEVYPEFQQDLEKTAFWATFKI